MARIYNIEMSTRQKDLVIMMIHILVERLRIQDDPTITYRNLAEQIGTSHRKLGQPLLRMAEVLRQCNVARDIPSLNALVVYSSTHLPCAEGLVNAEAGIHPNNNAELRTLMNRMNTQAKNFQDWDAVITDVKVNSFD